MTLQAGQSLGHFRLLEKIGEGGMGVVWRAVDTALGREVALKLLPDTAALDPERRARFEREARVLASLSHPGIAAIHSLEQAEGMHFLAMELVEGESLRRRLGRGTLDLATALDLGRQIAGALARAHDSGVIHRDLKPDNIMLTADGQAKLLDFGLAKLFRDEATDASRAATRGLESTAAGMILGTLGYMSPEQARGEAVDQRTDLWALGCVLFECLTGKRAFPGTSAAECLAAILEHEPNWRALPASTPEAVRGLLRRCLEKDPARRMRDAGDVRLELEEAAASRRRPARRRSSWTVWAAAAVALLAALWLVPLLRSPEVPPMARLPVLEQATFAPGVERFPAWSPDGASLAYCRETGGIHKIFVQERASGQERQVTTGPTDDIQPAWSPDGASLLFVRARTPGRKMEPDDVFGRFGGGDVWSVDLASGATTLVVEDAYNPAWSPDGRRIAVDAGRGSASRIWLVDERGRNPVQLTSDASEDIDHLRPRWSPDGRLVVFQVLHRTTFDIATVGVATGELRMLTDDPNRDMGPVISASGRHVYFTSDRSGGLNVWRLALDPSGRGTGQPQQITSGAGQDVDLSMGGSGHLALAILKQNADLWTLPVDPATGRPTGAPREIIATTREDSRGSWSPDGRFIAFNSDRAGDMNIWLHDGQDGSTRQLTMGAGGDYQPFWSPDGEHLVFFSSREGNADIYTVEVASGEMLRLTSDPAADVNPCYSPDGTHIAFQSDREGRREVWVMAADGSGQRVLTQTGVTGHFLRWTPDGSSILYRSASGTPLPILRVPWQGGEPVPLSRVAGGGHLSLSPGGSHVLDVTGHKTLWVSPLDGGEPYPVFEFDDPAVRIDYPVWSPDGTQVLFDRFRPEGGDIWILSEFE